MLGTILVDKYFGSFGLPLLFFLKKEEMVNDNEFQSKTVDELDILEIFQYEKCRNS